MPEVMLSSAQDSDSFSTSSSSSSPDPSDPSPLKKSLKTASDQEDQDQIQATLETWTTSHLNVSTPPTPIDLESALSYAVLRGHVSIISLLLDHRAPTTIPIISINSCDHDKSILLAIFDLFVQHGWSAANNTNTLKAVRSIIPHHDAESLLSWFFTDGATHLTDSPPTLRTAPFAGPLNAPLAPLCPPSSCLTARASSIRVLYTLLPRAAMTRPA